MEEKLWDRFMSWICSKIGHRHDSARSWWHMGALWTVCHRCRRIVGRRNKES